MTESEINKCPLKKCGCRIKKSCSDCNAECCDLGHASKQPPCPNPKLSPCPFCGKSNICIVDDGVLYRGRCRQCGAMGTIDVIMMDAVVSWNNRTPLIEAAPEMLALLKDLIGSGYGLKSFHRLSEHACKAVIADTWIPKIQAVIAKVEGEAQ